jgi:hypothetical protein
MPKLRFILYFFAAAAVAVCGYLIFKAVLSPSADLTWASDLEYEQSEIHELTFNWEGDRSCPQIPVTIGDDEYDLLFDTGCGSGIYFTDVLEDKIDFGLLGRSEELNRDGSHRGWLNYVSVEEIGVFNEVYWDIRTSMSDWSLFSSQPFNGAIGLSYFIDKTVTLDYNNRRIAVGSRPIDYDDLTGDYIVLDYCYSTSSGQGNLPFIEAEMSGEPITVYIDTGKNYSYLYDPESTLSITQKPSQFTDVPINIGGVDFMLEEVAAVGDLAQVQGLPYPTMIELNSDQIWKNGLLITFDQISDKIIIRKR